MHAAKDDGLGGHGRGGPGQLEAVAGKVGQFLDIAFLIVVGENRSVGAFLERKDFVDNVGHWQGFLVFSVAQEQPTARLVETASSARGLYAFYIEC